MGIFEDMQKAVEKISNEPPFSKRVRIHHPKCKAVETNKEENCNCSARYM
jgi:hypothetical protein